MRRGHTYRRRTKSGGWSRWHAVIDLEPEEDGKRRQITRSFDTRREAHSWLADQQHATEMGGPTVAEYLTGWLAQPGDLRASTVASYCGHVTNYLVPLLGTQPLRLLTATDVQALHQQLSAAGVSTALARRIHATLSSALASAVLDGQLPVNPAQRVHLPRADRYRPVVWSAEQASRFLAATAGDPLSGLWRLALVLGLRRGELLGLRWHDMDASAGTLTVHATRVAVGAQVVEGPPKSARGRRVLPLDATTLGVLSQHHYLQIDQMHNTWSLARHVFADATGQPLQPGWVSRRFADLVEQIGLPPIRFHDLRH